MTFKWPSRRRTLWVLGALVLMLISAYSIFAYYAIGANVSDRIGFPQFATQIPKLETESLRWGWLGIALPFLAALVLGFGKEQVARTSAWVEPLAPRSAGDPHGWVVPIRGYFFRLIVSVVGTLAFLVLLLLVRFAIYKMGIYR